MKQVFLNRWYARQEFTTRHPRFAVDAAFGPEHTHFGCNRYAILAELFVKNAGSDFVGGFDARRDTGALTVDNQADRNKRPADTSAIFF